MYVIQSYTTKKTVIKKINKKIVNSKNQENIQISFQNSKWPGLKRISVKILKSTLLVTLSYFTALTNSSFYQGRYPDCLKKARVAPLFKKGAMFRVSNY